MQEITEELWTIFPVRGRTHFWTQMERWMDGQDDARMKKQLRGQMAVVVGISWVTSITWKQSERRNDSLLRGEEALYNKWLRKSIVQKYSTKHIE